MENFAIKVENVSKVFKLPHEKNSSIKSAVVNFYKRKKGYELQRALNDVSFEVKKGEFFGIVGRNGSGKSTLLKLLAGIYMPSEGEVHVRGSLTPFIELGVGFNAELTGRENVYLNGALLGFSRKDMKAMYKDIVKFAEIEKFMDQKLKNYSSGMQVRLAFSIAIRAKSDILLIDEVLAVGDAAFQQKCFEYFYELKNSGRTVIFVSHDLESVQRFCDRAVWIDRGKMRAEGTAQEAVDEYRIHSFEESSRSAEEKDSTKVNNLSIKLLNGSTFSHLDSLQIQYNYTILKKQDVELRLAIVRDGIPFAQINTRDSKLNVRPGKYSAEIDISLKNFMEGEHYVYVAVCDADTGEELAFRSNAASFYIKSKDDTRYGLVRMESSWIRLPLEEGDLKK